MNDWTVFEKVLSFLVAGGAPAIVLYAASLLAENWAGWHSLPRWIKVSAPLVLSALLAVGAEVLLGYTEIVQMIAPWWTIVIVTIIAYISSQKAYMNAKANAYGAKKGVTTLAVSVGEDEDDFPF